MNHLDIDFETKSDVDLKVHGLARYAADPSTEVICMAWAIDDAEPQIWWSDEPMPEDLTAALKSEIPIYAHNADFERHIFDFVMANDFGISIKLERWRCTMIMCLAHGLPGALGEAAEAMGLPVQKQRQGARLIREYCSPSRLTEWKDGDKELMGEYCVYDVKVQQALRHSMRPLTDSEWAEYHLNCRVNDRGLPVDTEFVNEALSYADDIAGEVNGKIATLTDGMMTKHTQRKGRDAWLFPKLTEGHMKILEVYKDGEKKISLDEEHRNALLAVDDLDPDARALLELINDAGSAALKKYAAAANQHVDGRVHNTFLFHGAQTGRFSGRGIQPHNFRRDAFDTDLAESLIADIKEGFEIDSPTTTMARLLRPMIHSDKGIGYVDWSAIEGRVAPWLANSAKGEKKLDLYRQDKDVYVVTAADMFGRDEAELVSAVREGNPDAKTLRQNGKVAELSLQFAGGAGALQGMAKNYGQSFEDAEAENIVRLWRNTNSWAQDIWEKFGAAAELAVKNPGNPFEAERCTYQSDKNFLWCRLPSGRLLAYYAPRMEVYETPWGEERYGATFQTSTKVKAEEQDKKGLYHRNYLRPGLLFQNATQATAADILRGSLVLADNRGLEIIGHVHDEVLIEGPIQHAHILNDIMKWTPQWAEGLPLATGGVEWAKRYGK